MSYREQPGINNGVNSGEQFKLQSGHHHQQQQPSTSGAMQVSRISSLSDGSSRSHHPQQSYPQPFVEQKLPSPPAVPTSSSSPLSSFSFTTTTTTSSHLSPSSRISSSSSSSRGGGGGSSSEAGRSSKVFKDLHQYLSEGTDSAVTLHSLFSDKPTFFSSSPSSARSSSRQFSLADSTTTSSSKSKNKRTLDDLEEEDRAFECPVLPALPALPVPKTFGGDQVVDQEVDETTRQRLYAENLKTIEQFLSGSNNIAADNGSATIASSPSTAAEAVSTSTTAAEQQQQQQQPNTVMMDVDLPLR